MHSLHMVEKPGFKKLVCKLNPCYQLSSRRHFAKYELPKLYIYVRDSVVKPKLTQTKYFSVTTDMWTGCSTIPYMTFTVHSIDNEWSLQSFCLCTFSVLEDHTGQNLSEPVTDVLANWELTIDQIVATTIDNGSNIVSAFRRLDMLCLICFGHNLDLAIEKSL